MSKIFIIILIYSTLFIGLSTAIAKDALVFSDSSKPILQTMELSLKSNSLSYLYALQSEKENLAYKEYKQSDSLKLKNPNTALFYAAVPGFLIHGMGHFYARKPIIGTFLFGVEMLGLLFMVRSAFSGSEGASKDNEALDAVIGVTLFSGSWAYDMIGAPLAVGKENEKILQKKAIISIDFN